MSGDIIAKVLDAKSDMTKADKLIKQYKPFILSEASKVKKSSVTDSDDEYSIAMIGFHEAIRKFENNKGNFVSFASQIIRNRIFDFYRKENRHTGHYSIHENEDQKDNNIQLADERNHFEESDNMSSTKEEIKELMGLLESYGLDITDIAENAPKQERTLIQCREVIQFVIDNPLVLEDTVKSGKIPITLLSKNTKVKKKTIERHRKYILAMMLIQTNGFYIIRDHISQVLDIRKGGVKWSI